MKAKYSEIIKVEFLIFCFKGLSYISMPILYGISYIVEIIIYWLARINILPAMRKRYMIALINLELCFPEYSDAKRRHIWRQSFRESILVYLNYGLLFTKSANPLMNRVKLVGDKYLDDLYLKHNVILLAPHFCAFDIGANRLSFGVSMCSIYKEVNNYFFKRLKQARLRFNKLELFSTDDGLLPMIRVMKNKKLPLFYLPDLDYGTINTEFVPFLGHKSKATLNTLPRLTQLTNAHVLPIMTYRRGWCYYCEIINPLDNYPTGNQISDITIMNQAIEQMVMKYPEQYRWYYPIFKTQPGLPDNHLYESRFDKIRL